MTPQQTDDEPKRSTMKKMTTVSRRQAMATIAAAGGLTALSLGGSSSEEEISENLNVGGGPMSDAMSGNVARLYEGPSSDLDDPGIQGRFFKITEDDADTGWSAGTLLEDDGEIWKPIDLGVGTLDAERSHTEQVPTFDVTTYGADGDGETDDHDAIQDAIDACEDAGGGVVYFPNGHYAWQDTILVGDNCHLDFDWSTITGLRDGVEDGHALISNKGFDEDGHDGAANWSIRNIIIDSPDTNGITTAHSGEAEIHNVIGESILDHYVDIAGSLDILTSNLWVREAGTRFNEPFQWDSLPEDGGANNVIVDGEPVEPNYDGTINEGCSLKGARIRPENNTPDSSIHIHRDGHGDYVIENVVIENGGDGIFADTDIEFGDVQISNVKVKDSGRVIRFRDPAGQRGHLQLSNVIGVNVGGTTIFCDNHKSAQLDNVVLEDCEGFAAYTFENTPHVHLSNIVIDGHENQGIVVRGDAEAVVTNTTIKDTDGVAIRIDDDVELQYGGLVFDNVSSETEVNDDAEIVTFNSS